MAAFLSDEKETDLDDVDFGRVDRCRLGVGFAGQFSICVKLSAKASEERGDESLSNGDSVKVIGSLLKS